MKVTLVLTYYKRNYQLDKTIKSIGKTLHDNYNVIIVDDGGEDEIKLSNKNVPIEVIKIHSQDKTWKNPDPSYNTGILAALKHNPDIIIIQNAECEHEGDIITYAAEHITPDNYIPFACFSLNKDITFSNDYDLFKLSQDNHKCAVFDGDLGWYHHPIYKNTGFDFCSAMTAENMIKLNGFDERFIEGWGYGDNFLKHRIKVLGLKFETPEYPFVYHQWHYDNLSVKENRNEAIHTNKILYGQLSNSKEYRAAHLITKDFTE